MSQLHKWLLCEHSSYRQLFSRHSDSTFSLIRSPFNKQLQTLISLELMRRSDRHGNISQRPVFNYRSDQVCVCVQSVWSVWLIEWVLTWRAAGSVCVCVSRLQCRVERAHPLSFTYSVTTFTSLRTHFKDCHRHMCARQSITYQIHQRTRTHAQPSCAWVLFHRANSNKKNRTQKKALVTK